MWGFVGVGVGSGHRFIMTEEVACWASRVRCGSSMLLALELGIMVAATLQINDEAVSTLCQRYGVAKLSLFGSVLRSDFDPVRSDVDVLVDFLPGERKDLFKLLEMQRELGSLFGRKVDLTTPGSLSKYFRDDVFLKAKVLYDAA